MEIRDKTIVITGAGSGIGRALARRFRKEGARALVLADIDGNAVAAVAAEVDGLAITTNVAREADMQTLVERAEQELGPIDLFCSNAGVMHLCDLATPNDIWNTDWNINVMGHVHAAQAVIPRMLKRGGGYLLMTASAAGLLNQIGSASYAVTKHATIGFGEWLAMTHGHEGIKISMLCPQAVRTAMTDGNDSPAIKAAAVDGMMEPEQLAESVIQGLSDEHFLILPHPTVRKYMQRKSEDYDRWIRGMNHLQQKVTSAERDNPESG